MYYFSALFGKELYMFPADLLSIIRSLNTVFTAIGIIGIYYTYYVDCLLARSG
jgi:H2-forming N5,N10-methylenetetrahydromethanopterin dehydrogenase-like enzyme